MGLQEVIAAEQAAVRAYQQKQAGGRRQMVGDLNVAPYAGFRTPGIDSTKLFSDPYCILKDGERKKAEGKMYIWRQPDNAYTKAMVNRSLLRAVLYEEVDILSPYANVDGAKILTSVGPRQVVRTPGGLGLFEAPSTDALREIDQGIMPDHAVAKRDEHGAPVVKPWEKAYLADLAHQGDAYEEDLENLSASSLMGRVKGRIDVTDTQREPVV